MGFFTSYLKNDFLKLTKYIASYYFASIRKGGGASKLGEEGEKKHENMRSKQVH